MGREGVMGMRPKRAMRLFYARDSLSMINGLSPFLACV